LAFLSALPRPTASRWEVPVAGGRAVAFFTLIGTPAGLSGPGKGAAWLDALRMCTFRDRNLDVVSSQGATAFPRRLAR